MHTRSGLDHLALWWVALAVALVPAACENAVPGPEGGFVVRDSAGVVIVENAASPSGAEPIWRAADAPELVIGGAGAGPDEELFQVREALRLRDGRFAVANAGTDEILLFEPDGRLVGRAGGAGEGPGEFQALSWMGALPGDTIVAWDMRDRTVLVFDPEGAFLRETRIELEPVELDEGVRSPAVPAGLFGDGSYFLSGGLMVVMGGPSQGLVAPDLPHFRWDPRTGSATRVGDFPGYELYMSQTSGGPVPFGWRPVVTALDSTFMIAAPAEFEIAEHALDGRLVRLIRMERDPRRIEPEDIERHYEESLRGMEDEARREDRRRSLEEIPVPETMPHYSAVRVDPSGRLWVREYQAFDDEPVRWWVFDREGRLLGTAATPTGLDVRQVGEDWALGVRTDELGIEAVELYSLMRD